MGRKILVAVELTESPGTRTFRHAWSGSSVDDILAEKPLGLGTFWCAADQPSGVPIRRIYRTTEVPGDAACCVCHIGIRELQEMFS